jgi:hypothetical protein
VGHDISHTWYSRLNHDLPTPTTPSPQYVEVLTPQADCDLVCKFGLCRCNQVKIRSYWIKVSHWPNPWYIYKTERERERERERDLETQKEESHVEMEAATSYPAPS